MDLLLLRTPFPKGVNGVLLLNGVEICKTIELPWLDNKRRISCIPPGRYRLRMRYSSTFAWHFEVVGVPGRQDILIHPANHAAVELKGCIAPVLQHTGEGKGTSSRIALQRLKDRLYPLLERGDKCYLIIK